MKENGYATGMFGKWAGGYEGSVSTPDKRGVDEFYGYICQFQAHLYYPNFLNRFSRAAGDTATVRVILEENVGYPMHGEDYRKRTQYSADMIHQEALKWLDNQSDAQPFYGFFTYTLPHAELVQPNDSIVSFYKERFAEDKSWGGDRWSRKHRSPLLAHRQTQRIHIPGNAILGSHGREGEREKNIPLTAIHTQ